MQIIGLKQNNSAVTAKIPNSLMKGSDLNNRVQLIRKTDSQTLGSSSSEIVTIQYDPKPKAIIIKNSNV